MLTDPATTGEPSGDSPAHQVEPRTDTERSEEEAGLEEGAPVPAVEPPILRGLAAALVLGAAACLAGALIAVRDHGQATSGHPTAVRRPSKHATPAPRATPVLARVEGVVVGYDGGSGVLVVRSGGMRLQMHTGAATTYQADCVAPAHLYPGQRIIAAVVGYSNGTLNAQQIAPASGEACRSAPADPGTPRTPSPAAMLPGTGTLPPRPEGTAGADGAALPHP